MKGQWFPQSLFCPLVFFVDVFLAFKRIPHHSMYDMEKHVLSSCHTSSNSTLVSRPNWRDWWREVVFQRSRSIEKNNIVFVLFTNCTILKKAKKEAPCPNPLWPCSKKGSQGFVIVSTGVEVDIPTTFGCI